MYRPKAYKWTRRYIVAAFVIWAVTSAIAAVYFAAIGAF